MSGQRDVLVTRHLAEAKNAAGWRACAATARRDHALSREWVALAVECDRLLRRSAELLAR